MELQLCEEQRRMMDVQDQVRRRLAALSGPSKPQHPSGSSASITRAAAAAAAPKTMKAAARQSKHEEEEKDSRKLIKYSDKFRRTETRQFANDPPNCH